MLEAVEYVGLTLCMMGLVSSNDVSRSAEAEPDDVLLAAEDMGWWPCDAIIRWPLAVVVALVEEV